MPTLAGAAVVAGLAVAGVATGLALHGTAGALLGAVPAGLAGVAAGYVPAFRDRAEQRRARDVIARRAWDTAAEPPRHDDRAGPTSSRPGPRPATGPVAG